MSNVFNTSSASGVPALEPFKPTKDSCVSLANRPGQLSFQQGVALADCVWSLCRAEPERHTRSICAALKGLGEPSRNRNFA